MIKESQHTEKKNPYTHQRKRKPKLGNQQAERKREACDQSKHIYVHWIKYKKTRVQRRRKIDTFTAAELGTFERSVRTQELKHGSGRVDGGDLKPLSINSKNQTVVYSWFRLLHFSTASLQLKSQSRLCTDIILSCIWGRGKLGNSLTTIRFPTCPFLT